MSAALGVISHAARGQGKSQRGGDMVNLPLVDEGLMVGGDIVAWGAVTAYLHGGDISVAPTTVTRDRTGKKWEGHAWRNWTWLCEPAV